MTSEDALDRPLVAAGIAAVRTALGVAAMGAPRTVGWLLFRSPPGGGVAASTVTTLRMFAARDLALGVATLLARRDRSAALPGLLRAGALIDALDCLALLADRGRSLRPAAKWLSLAAAAGATGAGVVLAEAEAGREPRRAHQPLR